MEETAPVLDQWAAWLLENRFGGADQEQKRAILAELTRVRDRVLDHAAVQEGDVLLDVGAGDGLIAFAALSLLGPSGTVIFSDISQDLLDHSRSLAEQMGVADRVEFVRASADDLSAIQESAVDIVTTSSVLIYLADKRRAFEEFFRVLKPGGRLSIFEPINRFGPSRPAQEASGSVRPDTFLGYDVTPVQEIADKVRAAFARRQAGDQPIEDDPMTNFDERDLFEYAEAAGFDEVHLTYEAWVRGREPMSWDYVVKMSLNPKMPSLQEAMGEVLTEAEAQAFTAHFRPLVEAGRGRQRDAVAYLWAIKQ